MSEPGASEVDWTLCTFAGNRLRQHQAYLALPFRAKLAAIEEMGAVAEWFALRRLARGLPVHLPSGRPWPSGGQTRP